MPVYPGALRSAGNSCRICGFARHRNLSDRRLQTLTSSSQISWMPTLSPLRPNQRTDWLLFILKLKLATNDTESGLRAWRSPVGAHLRIPWECGVGFTVSGVCLTMEWRFFRHDKCCPRRIESLRGARIVRGRTRRATNTGRTARAVASANAERLAAPSSQL
jgi:hypothetical protein